MTAVPPSPPPTDTQLREQELKELLARAQPVRLISIDDVTIGQLMSLSFKLFIAWIPLGFVVAILWLVVRSILASVAQGTP